MSDVIDEVCEYLKTNGIPNGADELNAALAELTGAEPVQRAQWHRSSIDGYVDDMREIQVRLGYGTVGSAVVMADHLSMAWNSISLNDQSDRLFLRVKETNRRVLVTTAFATGASQGLSGLHDEDDIVVEVMDLRQPSIHSQSVVSINSIEINSEMYHVNRPMSYYYTWQADAKLCGDAIAELGGEVISAKFNIGSGSLVTEIPFAGWLGNTLHVFIPMLQNSALANNLIPIIGDLIIARYGKCEWLEQYETYTAAINAVRNSYSGITNMIESRRVDLRENNELVERRRRELTQHLRNVHDLSKEVSILESTQLEVAIDNAIYLTKLPGILEDIRAIRSCEIVPITNGMAIDFTTENLVMAFPHFNADMGEYRVRINTGISCLEEAVKVTASHSNSYEACHPHVKDGIPCFGTGSGQMAEAVGRRDWESVVRHMIPWFARYNPDSPHYIDDHFEESAVDTMAGWSAA